jgi:hypothetical protein
MASCIQTTLSREHHQIGAALLRIALGGLLIVQLVWEWEHRYFLRGPFGMYPDWLFVRELPTLHTPSFFQVQSELLFDILYLITIVVALLYLLGWKARWTGIWLYVLVWSFYYRNPLLVTGGEKMILATFPYMLLLDSAARFSVDAWRRPGNSGAPLPGPFTALIHNTGVLCIMLQVSIAYGIAGLMKLGGEGWRNGSAVSQVLQTPEFAWPGVTDLLLTLDPISRLLTYGTLAFELTLPILIWSRRTRWIAQLGAAALHVAIGALMGLTLFALQALLLQLVIADDRWYRSVWRRARSALPRREIMAAA